MDMNRQMALKILQINENAIINEELIKKQYRMMALKYHPDKNREVDASVKFQEIHSAYEFLKDKDGVFMEEMESNTYDSLLHIFINQIFDDDFQKQIIYMLISRILNKTSNRMIDLSLKFLERIDVSILKKIYDFLTHYSDIFGSLDFMEKMLEIIKEKEILKKDTEERQSPEYIILHPLLEDLFENHLYKLVEMGETILVPLWHHELIYDISGIDLYVECYPILPENVSIDEENNIHVFLKYSLKEIWSLEYIEINLGNRKFMVERNKLFITDFQKYVIKGKGIVKINEDDIYDVSEKGDIILYIDIIDV